MAYDQNLAERIRKALSRRKNVTEKKMFGGLTFMAGGNMCVGVTNDDLMARVGPDAHAAALKIANARPMDFTGRPMKSMVFVGEKGWKSDKSLKDWIDRGVKHARSLPEK